MKSVLGEKFKTITGHRIFPFCPPAEFLREQSAGLTGAISRILSAKISPKI